MVSLIVMVKGGTHLKVVRTCDAACQQAKLPDCDCLCDGKYHGVALKKGSPVRDKVDADAVLGLQGRLDR